MFRFSEDVRVLRSLVFLLIVIIAPNLSVASGRGLGDSTGSATNSLEDDEVDPDPSGLEDEDVDPDPNGIEEEEVDPDPNGLEDPVVDPDPSGFAANSIASTRGSHGLEDEDVDPDPNGLCGEPISLPLNSTHRGFAGSQPELFVLDFPVAGIAHLEITTPGVSGDAMKLGALSGRCLGLAGPQTSIIDRSPGSRTLAIREPGRYYFRAASQDPGLSPGAYKLSTGFVVADALDTGVELWGSAGLCQGVIDDHGDTRACATAIGSGATGEIENGWGDDGDFFWFSLKTMATVRVHTLGRTDTFGELYDQNGLKIASDDDRGENANFQIVRTLPPGRYFVRVEGAHGSEGRYALSIEPFGW